jgi:hypothetical protein
MRWVAPLMAFVLIGCGGGGATSGSHPTVGGTASPARTTLPTASAVPLGALPLGIVVKDFLVEGGPTYAVSLVGLDGRVAATATGAKRSKPAGILVQMPNLSASNSRLYYLDGDSKVMFLRPDGTSGVATNIPVDSNSAAVFAVSPDDTRIAVAILTFPFPAKTRIYVEDLLGGGNHIELFSSGTVMEWPVGWHLGHLVIGVGINAQPQNAYEGFAYGYRGYHVADATTGNRISAVCDGYDALAPPVPAGTVCSNGTVYEVSDWTGATRAIPADNGCGGGALSPDGSLIADCQGNPRTVALMSRDGSTKPTSNAGSPAGWIDSNHVVIRSAAVDSSLGILDSSSLVLTPIQAPGFFAGSIPGGL